LELRIEPSFSPGRARLDAGQGIAARGQGFLLAVHHHVAVVVSKDDLEGEILDRLRIEVCRLPLDLQYLIEELVEGRLVAADRACVVIVLQRLPLMVKRTERAGRAAGGPLAGRLPSGKPLPFPLAGCLLVIVVNSLLQRNQNNVTMHA